MRCHIAVLLLGLTAGFPVNLLELNQDQFSQLNGTGEHDVLATGMLRPHLQKFFTRSEAAIIVEPGDIVINHNFPDTTVDSSCDHTITVKGGHSDGEIKNSSYLEAGVHLSWNSVSVFVDAELDASLTVGGNVKVEVGKHVFGHHCTHLGHKTVGLDVKSDGKNGVGINMTASHAHIEHENGTWYLAFDFHADVVGRVIKWNADQITARGCKIKILGIQILSVCGFVERKVKSHLQGLMDHVTKIDAPKILKRLQDKINTAIGSKVRIPLKLPWMGEKKTTDSFVV